MTKRTLRNAVLVWCGVAGIEWHCTMPGKPTQNAFVESFNGRMRQRDAVHEHGARPRKDHRMGR
jgi:transposase InsO family protein